MFSIHGYFDPVPHLGQTDTGGQVTYVLELSKALAAKGIHVDIYTRWFDRGREPIAPVPDSPAVRVIRIAAGPWEFIPKEEIYRILPELTKNTLAFIRENRLRYDLFHGHYVDGGIVALDAGRALGKFVFFTPHSLGAWKREQMGQDPETMERQFNFSHRIAEETRIFEKAEAHTMTSEVQLEKLRSLYAYTRENVAVIECGTNTRLYRPLLPGESEAPTSLPEKYILCLSRIDSNKGHDLLLAAFERVRKEAPDLHLVIGGGSPEPREREVRILRALKTIVSERGMEDRVHFVGYVPDEKMASTYRQAEMFVLPSVFEPFGMTAIEAMACGTPVIASKFGGIRTVIASGRNGILVDPTNPEEMAGAILRLHRDRDQAGKMGMAGAEMVRQRLSWEAIAERHLSFYRRFM